MKHFLTSLGLFSIFKKASLITRFLNIAEQKTETMADLLERIEEAIEEKQQ